MVTSNKQYLYAFGAGFLLCLVLLWLPESNALERSEDGRGQEMEYIKTELLSPGQREALDDWEVEGEVAAHEADEQDARTQQPQAK